MCGRYYIGKSMKKELFRETGLRFADSETDPEGHGSVIAPSDIHPGDRAPVILSAGPVDTPGAPEKGRDGTNPVILDDLVWGFPFHGKLTINARVETLMEKPVFSRAARSRRCVLPATGFYEWDREKNRFAFELKNQPILYLAGIYDYYENQRRFVILTTAANASMAPVHDRMPLIIPPDRVESWICQADRTEAFLKMEMPELSVFGIFRQQTLF